ncbi:hypothetical protein ACFXTH_042713 [Malus domestica]
MQTISVQGESSNVNSIPFGYRLSDSNFKVWSKMMEVHASSLGKQGYLTGKIPAVDEDDPGYVKWSTEDAIVRGWLLKTMEPHLLGLFIDLPTAKDIWESVTQMFYDGSDESQYYELRCKATRTRQDGRPINLYFTELKSVWQDLDKRRPLRMVCGVDLKTRKEELAKDRVYDFLVGLDSVFDQVRSEILRIKPIPEIEECFNLVRCESQRQVTMMGTKTTMTAPPMAMATKAPGSRPPSNGSSRSFRTHEDIDKDKLHCNHCNGTRHTEETCFEIHGYPEWYWERKNELKARGNKRAGQARMAATGSGVASNAAGSQAGSKAQQEKSDASRGIAAVAPSQLRPSPLSPIAAAQFAVPISEAASKETETGPLLSLINQISMGDNSEDSGKIGTVLITSTKRDTGWIIDSGATDHMTYDASLFYHMTSPSKEDVITANGDVAPITGAGSISLTPSLSIHNTLLVPTLSNHLLSVGQVTEQLDCVVLMFPTFCLLQDIQTRAIIGRDTKRRGLYYVDDVSASHVNQVCSGHLNKNKTIWLWHRRLGHASFGYLKKLLPSLFHGIPDSNFQCNDCILAKSHRTSYHSSFNKRTIPFELVHSDVWGPSPVATNHGVRWFVIFVDDCTRMTWLYTMKHKSDVGQIFNQFYCMVKNQFSLPLKVLRSDNGGEYINTELSQFF